MCVCVCLFAQDAIPLSFGYLYAAWTSAEKESEEVVGPQITGINCFEQGGSAEGETREIAREREREEGYLRADCYLLELYGGECS